MAARDRNSERWIPTPVIVWLALIVATFVVGGAAIALFASLASDIFGIGVVTNVGLAIGLGIVCGWRMTLGDLPVSIVTGALVTVVGVDSLSPGLIVFDVVAIPVALIGMALLLVVGAGIGTGARCLRSGRRCRRCLSQDGRWRRPWAGYNGVITMV